MPPGRFSVHVRPVLDQRRRDHEEDDSDANLRRPVQPDDGELRQHDGRHFVDAKDVDAGELGVNVIQLFSFVVDDEAKLARVFTTGNHFSV